MKVKLFVLGCFLSTVSLLSFGQILSIDSKDSIVEIKGTLDVSNNITINGEPISAEGSDLSGVRDTLLLKADIDDPTFTTGIAIGSADIEEAELEILDDLTVTTAELNYSSGLTGNIQDQLDDSVYAGSILPLLTDVKPLAYLGCGVGLAGDTVLIDASLNGYGFFYSTEDTTEIVEIITNIPTGDTVNYSVVFNDTLWSTTACDTLVTINAAPGETKTTSFTGEASIPEDVYVWIEMDAVVVTKKPIKFRSEILGYIKRDE